VTINKAKKIVGIVALILFCAWSLNYAFTINHDSSKSAKNYLLANKTIREEMRGNYCVIQNNSGSIRETRAYSAGGEKIDESSTAFLSYVLVNGREAKYLKIALWRGTEPEWKVYKAVLYSWRKESIVLCDKSQWFSNTPILFNGGF
jgi:hypothetical protein